MTPEEVRFREGLCGSYQSQHNQSPLDISHSYSVNTISSVRDLIISEDLLQGQRINGRMSNVRRFFSLFVTFDFLFISLMWLICIMLVGENIMNALKEQILHYDIHTSLFDIVLVAFCRFLVLTFFYAIIYINHWIVISLSTALSCAFLIGKVFMYDWPKSSQPVFEVLLVLASFVLSWGEAWFLDGRVIPQESHASRYLITANESERAPLIRSYINGLPSTYTESIGNFYSPMGTPEGSMCRFEPSSVLRPCDPANFTRVEVENYKLLAALTLQKAWDIHQKTDWKLELQENEDVVYSRKDSKTETIFKIMAEIQASPKFLLEELFYNVQHLASWNKALKESYKIETIDEHTDICYQISAKGAKGLVDSRDFVNLRNWAQVENCYVIACVKCDHPNLPDKGKYPRGENGVGCYIMEALPGEPNKCRFIWIFNTNLKLKVPKIILDKELKKMMLKFVHDLREHIISKAGENKND